MPKEINYAKFNGDGYIHIPIENDHHFSNDLHDLTSSDFTFYVMARPDFVKPIKLAKTYRYNWVDHYEDFALLVRSGKHTGLFYTTVNNYKGSVCDNKDKEYTTHSQQSDKKIVHLVFCVNNKENKYSLYVNGLKVSETSLPEDKNFFNYPKNHSDYFIGSANPFTEEVSCFYKGKIYEVAMWNTELGEDEIKILYENVFDMDLTDDLETYKSSESIIGYWTFDTIYDEKVFDDSFSEHHGILHNVEIGVEKI